MSLDFADINPAAARSEAAASTTSDLPASRAQYVVVGGGVIGTSIAYHLRHWGERCRAARTQAAHLRHHLARSR